jgi:hypothetical protein
MTILTFYDSTTRFLFLEEPKCQQSIIGRNEINRRTNSNYRLLKRQSVLRIIIQKLNVYE